MVKIGDTFSRFGRVVHDVSRELGKEIHARRQRRRHRARQDAGRERIADPLTHLVRNAIDHGIEPADVRAQRGKPAAGMVRLNAYHDSGHHRHRSQRRRRRPQEATRFSRRRRSAA